MPRPEFAVSLCVKGLKNIAEKGVIRKRRLKDSPPLDNVVGIVPGLLRLLVQI